jgi:hypothetical protein
MEYLVSETLNFSIETAQNDITEWVQLNLPFIKRGDLVSLQAKKNRFKNDWTFIWDGNQIVELEFDHDKCGHLPRQFEVSHTEFSPKWWINLIENNYIFWLADEIKHSMTFKKVNGIIFSDVYIGKDKDKDMWRCFVVTKVTKNYIFVDNAVFHCAGFSHMFPPFDGPCFYMELL